MLRFLVVVACLLIAIPVGAVDEEETGPEMVPFDYLLQAGDLLEISIWNEDGMTRQVLVLPDGMISYPLAGHLNVAGKTPKQAEDEIKQRLVEGEYYNDPPLTVSVVDTRGNRIYVLGRVRTPGAVEANQPLDVMQVLSVAGGLDEFADKKKIIVLRRDEEGQKAIPFDYTAVHAGSDLSSNILLQSGDILVVPEAGIF